MPEIRLLPCLSDNYAVLVKEGDTVLMVDAPEAAPIRAALDREGWQLTHILITHKHADHVDGIADLVAAYKPQVIGPEAEKASIPHIGKTVREGDKISIGPMIVDVIAP